MTAGIEHTTVRLDDISLARHFAHYPEQLRELCMWLGSYIREECHRDLDLLVVRAQKLGVEFDKTTWSKVLRGRWNRDGHDNELATPVVSLPKIVRAIQLLRDDSRRREMDGKVPFVRTKTANTIIEWLDLKRMVDRVCKFGILVGETGTQKTATLQWYCREHNHGLCKLIESPATPSHSQFITELANAYGSPRDINTLRKHHKIIESVNDTRTIMIDNAQRLYDPRLGGHQPAFHFIQKLQEDTGCTIILCLTPDGEKVLFQGSSSGFFEQFVGRAGGWRNFLRLPPYPSEEDVQAIAEAFGVQGLDEETTMVVQKIAKGQRLEVSEPCTVLQYLTAVAREPGRIRQLFEDLQTAKIRAERMKARLTIKHIKHARKED